MTTKCLRCCLCKCKKPASPVTTVKIFGRAPGRVLTSKGAQPQRPGLPETLGGNMVLWSGLPVTEQTSYQAPPLRRPMQELIQIPSNPILAQITAWMRGFVGTYVVSNQATGTGNGNVRWADITAAFPESLLRNSGDRNPGVSLATDSTAVYGLYGLSRPVTGGFDIRLNARSWARSSGASLSTDSRVASVRYTAAKATGFGAVETSSGSAQIWYQVAAQDGGTFSATQPDGHEGVDRFEAGVYHDLGGTAIRADVHSWSEFTFGPGSFGTGYYRILTETRRVVLNVAVLGPNGLVLTQKTGSYLVPVNPNRVDPYRYSFGFSVDRSHVVLRWLGGYLSIDAAGQITAASAPAAGVTPYLQPVPAITAGPSFNTVPGPAPALPQTLTVSKVTRTVNSNGGSAGTIVTVAEARNVAAPSAVTGQANYAWIDPDMLSIPGATAQVGDKLNVSWSRSTLPFQTGNVGAGNVSWIDTPMHGTIVQASSSKPLFKPGRAVLPAGQLTFQVTEAGWYAVALMVETTANAVRYYTLAWASAAGGGTLKNAPPTDIYNAGFGPAPVYLQPGVVSITPPAGSFHSAALVGICPGVIVS